MHCEHANFNISSITKVTPDSQMCYEIKQKNQEIEAMRNELTTCIYNVKE